ncbi:MAG: corrinoid protein [Clostridia bacterium]|nr:corrinoid protein [Clostridia bacterium]
MGNRKCEELYKAIVEGYSEDAEALARQLLDEGTPPMQIIDECMVPAIQEVGRLYETGEYFLPELMMGAEAMQTALKVVQPALRGEAAQRQVLGTVVIGTVAGDLHDIGKSIVATMLSANGFDVHDLGVDVSASQFLDKVREVNATILGMSALLPTTMPYMQRVIESAKEAGLRDQLIILVGGAPVTPAFAEKIGADGYADDAAGAVQVAKQLVAQKAGQQPTR